MRLTRKAYSLIFRARRSRNAPEIRTRERTILLPYGTPNEDINVSIQRLICESGFVAQYYIETTEK